MPRKYQPLWEKLKIEGKCSVAAHKALHPRIIKALACEKNRDVAYKILMDENNKHAITSYKVEQSRIKFFLKEYYRNGKIPLEDL